MLPVLLIFCVAFGLRVAWMEHTFPEDILFAKDPVLFGDEVFYYHTADSMATGGGYRDPYTLELTSDFPPGYPFLLTPFFVVFGPHLLVAKLLNVTLAALTPVLVYALGTVVSGRRTGVLAGGLMALFPSQVLFSGLIMTEPLFVALSAVLVLALTVSLRSRTGVRAWQAIALGLLLGYMSLVRAEALLLLGAVPVLWLLAGTSWRNVARALPVLLIGATIVIAPWTARNYARFDEFILLRGGAGDSSRVVRIGLSPDYETWKTWENRLLEPDGFGAILGDYAREPWQVAIVGEKKLRDLFVRDDPIYYVRGQWLEVYFQAPLSDAEAERWTLLSNWYYYVVGGWAVLSAPLWWRRLSGPLLASGWFAVAWTLVYALFVPDFRYHFPILPMVCVLAACGAVAVWDAIAGRRGAQPSWTSDRASGITEQR